MVVGCALLHIVGHLVAQIAGDSLREQNRLPWSRSTDSSERRRPGDAERRRSRNGCEFVTPAWYPELCHIFAAERALPPAPRSPELREAAECRSQNLSILAPTRRWSGRLGRSPGASTPRRS